MRIAFLGNFGTRNFGNDASLEAMIDALRENAPTAELSCICPNPAGIRERFGIATIGLTVDPPQSRALRVLERLTFGYSRRMANLCAAFVRVRGQDVLIVPGTGLLDDYRDRPRGWPFMLLRWCLAARLNGVRVAFVGIGAGPILHPTSRRLMKWATQLCRFRSFRDQPSREFVRSLGVDVSQDPVVPDLAFGLPVGASPPPSDPGCPPTIGLGVMTYYGWVVGPRDGDVYASYLQRLTRLAAALGRKGYAVRVLMGDASDEHVANDLIRALAGHEQQPAPDWLRFELATDIHDVLRQIETCDVVVAVRYHNIIAALLQERPAISLEYAGKNQAVLRTFGLGDFCHHIEDFEVDAVLADVERLLNAREHYAALVAERLAEARTAHGRHARTLATSLLDVDGDLGASRLPAASLARGDRRRPPAPVGAVAGGRPEAADAGGDG